MKTRLSAQLVAASSSAGEVSGVQLLPAPSSVMKSKGSKLLLCEIAIPWVRGVKHPADVCTYTTPGMHGFYQYKIFLCLHSLFPTPNGSKLC